MDSYHVEDIEVGFHMDQVLRMALTDGILLSLTLVALDMGHLALRYMEASYAQDGCENADEGDRSYLHGSCRQEDHRNLGSLVETSLEVLECLVA